MALSLDDKLLGEKTHYYCSSSSEDEEETKSGEKTDAPPVPEPEIGEYKGYSTNTGPKGVINDWRRFKQLENEKRMEQEAEKLQLGKKLTLTCRTAEEDERIKQKDDEFMEQIEAELEEFEDEFMKEYREKRLQEMRQMLQNVPKFGKVINLEKDSFLDAIDKEKPMVTIIIHVYEDSVPACIAMNGCLQCLAQEYPTVKFCKITAKDAKLSHRFSVTGVPALLVYKKGEMIGNFIRLSDELGQDFFATDVESFLNEHCLLPEQGLSQAIIKNSTLAQSNQSDTDSDFDVD